MKIGILTHPLGLNYGGLFQAYALQYVLTKMGYDVTTINRKSAEHYKSFMHHVLSYGKRLLLYYIKGQRISPLWNPIVSKKEFQIITQNMMAFVAKNMKTTPIVDACKLADLDQQYLFDIYIVGSDQVWNEAYCPNSFLDFVKRPGVKKLFYAASCGKTSFAINPKLTKECATLAQQFQAISVREKSLCKLSADHFGKEAIWVLDPTMLLRKEEYLKLIEPQTSEQQPIIFSYILDKDSLKSAVLEATKTHMGLEVVNGNIDSYYVKDGRSCPEDYILPAPEDWFCHLNQSAFVVTDSFHGMVFSIIFNKQFAVVANPQRGIERFTSLLEALGIPNRLVTSIAQLNTILNTKIDYDAVNSRVDIMRQQSLDFLTSNLAIFTKR